jgi:phosphate/sulfate permease
MEAFMAEHWYWLLGTVFFTFVLCPILIGYCVVKFFTAIRDWWHETEK